MNRFFCENISCLEGKIILDDREQAHHIKNVLKLKPGEKIAVFDKNGNEYACVIIKIDDRVHLEVKNMLPKKDTGIKLTIACAIPKKSKIDDIIDKLVQLGVDKVIPLKTERVIVKLDKRKEALRLERWRKIALSAAKQSQRSSLAIIEPIKTFKEVVALSKEYDLKLIPNLAGERISLKDALSSPLPVPLPLAKILVLIGPEGDFTEEEIGLAEEHGFIPVSLGNLVLRVDTAAIAIASYIRLGTVLNSC